MKANHNHFHQLQVIIWAVFNGSKILKWKQITTELTGIKPFTGCFQWFKDTKMKANHNGRTVSVSSEKAVFNGSKILKWKQITTNGYIQFLFNCCFQWFKDTKMKANHNLKDRADCSEEAVFNGSKILKWKQITTEIVEYAPSFRCFQWFKDTKMKANHNNTWYMFPSRPAVFNGSKILKWKQITTNGKKKAEKILLFSMVQRY